MSISGDDSIFFAIARRAAIGKRRTPSASRRRYNTCSRLSIRWMERPVRRRRGRMRRRSISLCTAGSGRFATAEACAGVYSMVSMELFYPKGGRITSLERFAADCPIGAQNKGLRGPIFHYFPVAESFVLTKCRQISVLGLTKGSLGSFYTAIVRRPLVSRTRQLYITRRALVQWANRGYLRSLLFAITSIKDAP